MFRTDPADRHGKTAEEYRIHAAVPTALVGLPVSFGFISPGTAASVSLVLAALLLSGLLIHIITLRRRLQRTEQFATDCSLRLKALENNLPESVMFQLAHHADRTFQFTFMGKGYSDILGLDRAALLADARVALEQVYEQDLELLREAFRLGKEKGRPARLELRALDKNGELKWLQVCAAPRMGERTLFWDGFFLDITEIKAQLAVLQDEKQNLQRLIEAIDDMLIVCDMEGRILHASPAAQHLLQFSVDDTPEISIFRFFPESRRTGIYGLIARMQTREHDSTELPLTGGSDESMLCELRASRGQWEQKEAIYLQVRNITERKKAENLLKESREVLVHIINTIPMSVYWKDTKSTYHGCNKTFAKTHGLTDIKDIVGKKSQDLAEDDLARDLEELEQQVIQTNRVLELFRKPYLREDGSQGRRDISILPLHGDSGLPAGVLGIWRDVTENSMAEERLKRTLEDMERFNTLLRSRERRTLELKAEINSLLKQTGQEPRYKTTTEELS